MLGGGFRYDIGGIVLQVRIISRGVTYYAYVAHAVSQHPNSPWHAEHMQLNWCFGVKQAGVQSSDARRQWASHSPKTRTHAHSG